MVTIPKELEGEYPFKNNYITTDDGHKIHYVDEGDKSARPVIMVHGNPTWSFYYRNVIKELQDKRRVIAIDHIGCGLSDKPQRYNYSLQNHIRNLTRLVEKILPKDSVFDLIVHDWGGAIGMGMATTMPERVGKVVILNTAAFTSTRIPKRINFCKFPILGEQVVRHFNAFAFPATFMAVQKPLNATVKKGYLLPYNNYQNRIATARFVKDIPMTTSHQSWDLLKNIENNLNKITGEKIIIWGEKDFCFNNHFYDRWLKIYPEAKTFVFPNGGHYILEDEQKKAIGKIKEFITR